MRIGWWTIAVVYGYWVLYSLILIVQFRRVRRDRSESEQARRNDYRDPRSMWGLALEGVSFMVVWSFMEQHPPTFGVTIAATALAAVSILMTWAAVRELGLHFRIKAVVTTDHELIHTGPYALVRHPIYLGLMGMLLATGLMVSRVWSLLLATAIFIAGTEIRVSVEENLLRKRFGPEFDHYRSRVKAYVPFVR